MYLDDGFATSEDFFVCQKMSSRVWSDLFKAGFIANDDKSIWEPKQLIKWLGFEWNLKNCTLEIPQKKFNTLKNCISNLVEGNLQLTCRNLAKICGKIISLIPALGNICQIMTKHMHMSICCKNSWDETIDINEDIFVELQFWYFQGFLRFGDRSYITHAEKSTDFVQGFRYRLLRK